MWVRGGLWTPKLVYTHKIKIYNYVVLKNIFKSEPHNKGIRGRNLSTLESVKLFL